MEEIQTTEEQVQISQRKFIKSAINTLYFLLDNIAIHGFRFLTNKYNAPTRVFWLITCSISAWGLSMMIQSIMNYYNTQSTSFVLDSNYLDWNTTFPAVFVCETPRLQQSSDTGKKIEHSFGSFRYTTTNRVKCDKDEATRKLCSNIDHDKIMYNYVEKNLSNVIDRVTFLNTSYDEKGFFKPKRTLKGPCFVANAQGLEMGSTFNKLLYVNRTTGPGILTFRLKKKASIYVVSPQVTPVISHDSRLKINDLSYDYEYIISETEVVNDRVLLEEFPTPETRECLFPDEIPPGLEPMGVYSSFSCEQDCQRKLEMAVANCTTHLMPEYYRKDYCGYKGLQIISNIAEKDFEKYGKACDCKPSCNDIIFEVLQATKKPKRDESETFSYVTIRMLDLPVIRYKRIVMISAMDLAVSVGGTAGLFFGVSMLSVCEIFYLFFISKFKRATMTN